MCHFKQRARKARWRGAVSRHADAARTAGLMASVSVRPTALAGLVIPGDAPLRPRHGSQANGCLRAELPFVFLRRSRLTSAGRAPPGLRPLGEYAHAVAEILPLCLPEHHEVAVCPGVVGPRFGASP